MNKKNYQKGFSLLELIVAIGVFTIVATLAVGSLLILTTTEKKAFNLQTNQDNARFAIESMARELRTGINYAIGHTECTTAGCLNFTNSSGVTVAYELGGATNETIMKWVDADDSGFVDNGESFLPVTADEVQVSELDFYVNGTASGDGVQPRVTIVLLLATPGTGRLSTELRVQTSISRLKQDS